MDSPKQDKEAQELLDKLANLRSQTTDMMRMIFRMGQFHNQELQRLAPEDPHVRQVASDMQQAQALLFSENPNMEEFMAVSLQLMEHAQQGLEASEEAELREDLKEIRKNFK